MSTTAWLRCAWPARLVDQPDAEHRHAYRRRIVANSGSATARTTTAEAPTPARGPSVSRSRCSFEGSTAEFEGSKRLFEGSKPALDGLQWIFEGSKWAVRQCGSCLRNRRSSIVSAYLTACVSAVACAA